MRRIVYDSNSIYDDEDNNNEINDDKNCKRGRNINYKHTSSRSG